MSVKIITNNVPREIDYDVEFGDCGHIADPFVMYKGQPLYISQMMPTGDDGPLSDWDAYESDTAFSGTLIKLVEDNERVIVARYLS